MEAMPLCPWDAPVFLLFSSSVPALLYYTYIPVIILSLLFSLFVLFKDEFSLLSKLFFWISLSFCFWVINVLVQWASNSVVTQMFAWQMTILFESAIYLLALYFAAVYFEQKDIKASFKLVLFVLALPIIILLPTSLNVESFYLTADDCGGNNGQLWSYAYILEITTLVWVLFLWFRRVFDKDVDNSFKKQITILTTGLVVFLGIFFASNYLGELTQIYTINLVGPAGLVLFLSLMAYLIVRFRAFHIQLLSAEVLVVGLWFLVFAVLFINRLEVIKIVIVATLVLLSIMGYRLIRGVKKEVYLREQLEVANEGQANLIHIINHQIKGYLAKSRNIFSELLTDKNYGACTVEAQPMLQEGFKSLTEGVDFVKDFLDASNVEQGTYTYNMVPVDFKSIVLEMAEKQKAPAEEKGLNYSVKLEDGDYNMKGDVQQLGQAVRNLIDNSIRYTPKGSLLVNLSCIGKKILLAVKDTGVGISNELKPKLFTKGGRDKDSMRINVNSTGFGLSFVKGVVEAHKGRVWADSAGTNKGSTFYMELPTN